MALWCVRVRYATQISPGILDVTYDVDDLADIAVLIRQGPDRSFLYSHVMRGDEARMPIIPIEGGDALPEEIVQQLERLDKEGLP